MAWLRGPGGPFAGVALLLERWGREDGNLVRRRPCPWDELGHFCSHDRGRNSGWDVLGIMDGFEHLIEGRIEEARPLSITDVSRIHAQGGSVLRTSRANPTVRDEDAADPDWRLHACLESLQKLGIDALVTIGGDDTAFSASRLAGTAGTAGGSLRVAHVPKTIRRARPRAPSFAPGFSYPAMVLAPSPRRVRGQTPAEHKVRGLPAGGRGLTPPPAQHLALVDSRCVHRH